MRSVHVLYVVTNVQWILIECYVCNKVCLGSKIAVIQAHFIYLNIHFGMLNVALQQRFLNGVC